MMGKEQLEESLRLLALISTVVTPPMKYAEKNLRKVFDTLSESHGFSSFSLIRNGAVLSSGPESVGEVRKFTISTNQLIIEYHHVEKGLISRYKKLIEDSITQSTAILSIPMFVMQQCFVRKLTTPEKGGDARLFLAHKVCKIEDKPISIFQRSAHVIGLRLFFPASQDKKYDFDIKIESYIADTQSIFIENRGRFMEPILPANLAQIFKNITLTDDFIDTNAIDFIAHFY